MLCQRLLRTVIGIGTAVAATAFAGLGVAVAAQAPAASPARACNPSVATPVAQPSSAQMAAAGLHELPVAALERRVDLVAPASRIRPTSRTACFRSVASHPSF